MTEPRLIEHFLIPMADGTRLAGRMWLPPDAGERPVPAILEYHPYRKRDIMRARDALVHPYLAARGYACVRVDLRGSGDSEGVLTDQFRPQEFGDGLEVIRWIADQDWCDGNVGMMGLSWGGFNALQVAAERPPELKAIVTVCSTDDLYRDNMHYMGGCLLSDNLSEATTMFSVNTCPPDPALVGEAWRDMWLDRLRGSGLWLDTWLRHQRRDDYWKHGSVCEDYGAIGCPVMAVGGWADGYTNTVFRLLEHLEVPRLGLVGPWGHRYPHLGVPGPAIGFLHEMLRWWDHWLKGEETGIMAEPVLRAWMQDSVPPTTYYEQRPGRWVGEDGWPSPRIEEQRRSLAPGRILAPEDDPQSGEDAMVSAQTPLSVGLFAGKWCSYSAPPDLPHDQREEDGGAIVFTSAPLDEPLEILGAPAADFELSVDRPVAMIAVRLSEMAADDKATRVTYGLLNLTHRHGHERPERLEPGRRYRVRVPLNHVGQRFSAGNRLRLSVSASYWPLAWPPPEPVRLTLYLAESALVLPVRPPRAEDEAIAFRAPESSDGVAVTAVEPAEHRWLVYRDLAADVSTLEVIKDEGVVRIEEIDLEMTNRTYDWYTYREDDFLSVRGETRTERAFRRGDWQVRTTTRTVLTCDATHFHVDARLRAWESGDCVYSEDWQRSIARDHV